jgi:hypothetical protein
LAYIPPSQVHYPRGSWTLTQVLVDQGPSTETEGRWSLAIGTLDGKQVLAVRWNGSEEAPTGDPQVMGRPAWFILPPEMEECLLGTVNPDTRAKTEALLC